MLSPNYKLHVLTNYINLVELHLSTVGRHALEETGKSRTKGTKRVVYWFWSVQAHEEWFSFLEKSEQPGVAETGHDTPYPIVHGREVPLSHVQQKGKLMNVLHVPTITKNLVSIEQIVD